MVLGRLPTGKDSKLEKRIRQISLKEVRGHDSREDCWIVINNCVYDVTSFLDQVSYQLRVMNRACYSTDFSLLEYRVGCLRSST